MRTAWTRACRRARRAARLVPDTRHDLVETWTPYEREGFARIPAHSSEPYARRRCARELT
ncbi:hypothetical protein RKE29_10595 [Streptomyces sp. B1866]|nr:hypothetical protein [Streptomyces sp. B1866]